MNHFLLEGNLTRDPEVNTTLSGKTVINFSIANNDDRRKKPDGSWETVPSFFDMAFWTEKVEYWTHKNRLVKGNHVVCEGQEKQDRWEYEGQQYSRVVHVLKGYPVCVPRKAKAETVEQIDDEEIPF